jgi:hypothetical protein
VIAVVGILYAVLLGFLTVIVWEHYAQSEERAQAEVDAATDIYRFGRLLPAPQAQRIRAMSNATPPPWPTTSGRRCVAARAVRKRSNASSS